MFYPRFFVSYSETVTLPLSLNAGKTDTRFLRTSFSVQRCNRNKMQHILTYFRYNGQM